MATETSASVSCCVCGCEYDEHYCTHTGTFGVCEVEDLEDNVLTAAERKALQKEIPWELIPDHQ
eukprot:3010483-Karenia_brevis.AAC.1